MSNRGSVNGISRALSLVLIWELVARWLLDWILGDRVAPPVELEPWNARVSVPLLNVVFVYCLWTGRRHLFRFRSNFHALAIGLVHLFAIFVILQSPFRGAPFMEFIRSLSLVLMLESAIAVAGELSEANSSDLRVAYRRLRRTVVGSIVVALLLSMALPNFAVWVIDFNSSVAARGWLPFFVFSPAAILPLLNLETERRLAIAPTFVLGLLAAMTQTRTLLFIFILWVALTAFHNLSVDRRRIQGLIVAATLGLAAAVSYRSIPRLRSFELTDGVNGLNGRLELNGVLLDAFLNAGPFGLGQEGANQAVLDAGTRATTEHGMIVWFSSYGAAALVLIAVVLLALFASSMILVDGKASRTAVAASTCTIIFGILAIWTAFGSSAAASDWFGWIFLFYVLGKFGRSTEGSPLDPLLIDSRVPAMTRISDPSDLTLK